MYCLSLLKTGMFKFVIILFIVLHIFFPAFLA